jgi:hypothetical protein
VLSGLLVLLGFLWFRLLGVAATLVLSVEFERDAGDNGSQ